MKQLNFWEWLLIGVSNGKNNFPGYRRILNVWLFMHVLVGISIAGFSIDRLSDVAKILMIPLSVSLIGIAFAASSNAWSIILSKDISDIFDEKTNEESFYNIIYTFQLAALFILSTIGVWCIAALKFFDPLSGFTVFLVKIFLYALTSCAFRECWHVIFGVSSLTVLRRSIRKANNNHLIKSNDKPN